MERVRIYQLAKELNKPTKDVIDALAKLGIKVGGHNSMIDEYQVAKVKDFFSPKGMAAKPKLIIRKIGEVKPKDAEELLPVKDPELQQVESVPPREDLKVIKKIDEPIVRKPEPVRQTVPFSDAEIKKAAPVVKKVVTFTEAEVKPVKTEKKPEPAAEAKPAEKKEETTPKKKEVKPQFKTKEERLEIEREKAELKRQKKEKKRRTQEEELIAEVVEDGAVKIVQLEKQQFTIKELADLLRVGIGEIMKVVLTKGFMLNLNSEIDFHTAVQLSEPFNIILEQKEVMSKRQEREEEMLMAELEEKEENLKLRPPVVTIMGHVDHGKTKLLDYIRKANVVDREAGGITQHIGAYQVSVKEKMITFLDTPGHAAFTEIRARGAQVTDVVVLIVAADDGVMPQTKEAIDHAKAAAVPIIVAINKVDKPDADPDRVKQQLTEYGLVAEEWGGDTICVPVSAKFGQGVDDLLDMILLVSELKDLKANPDKDAQGIIIEAKLTANRGPVATAIIKSGTLKIGDPFVIGPISGKVRAMLDYNGNPITTAPPSTPVEILGISQVPSSGDILQVVKNEKEAKAIALQRQVELEEEKRRKRTLSLESFSKRISEGEVTTLNILIKADAQGSVVALETALSDLHTDKVHVNIVHSGTGAINESDIMLAKVSEAIVFGFNVVLPTDVKKIADDEGVDIKLYNIIYKIIEDVQEVLSGMAKPEYEKIKIGTLEVRQVFTFSKVGVIAGCFVKAGRINRAAMISIVRNNAVIFEGKLSSLKRFQDDVKEVKEGYECGVVMKDFDDFKPDDLIEAYELVEKK